MKRAIISVWILLLLLFAGGQGWAQSQPAPPAVSGEHQSGEEEEIQELEEFEIQGKAFDLIGISSTASFGMANHEELSQRPFLRRGELLEVIPGMVTTQHAGGGKANQYFIRGYNLDHGTDFHVGLEGMPVNLRTHAHGQGYADINFIIPEFTERLDYFKGPFFAELGDLSTAGGAQYYLFRRLPGGIASTTLGENNFQRYLLGDTFEIGNHALSLGGEYTHEDGPWDIPNNYDRFNGFARFDTGDESNFFSVMALGHQGSWDSSDQIPMRALEDDRIDRFGTVDETTGGDTSRFSLQAAMRRSHSLGITHLDAWVGRYQLDLFSNFTYALGDPDRGDQFEQQESRIFSGFNFWHQMDHPLGSLESRTKIGLQSHNDWIDDIGLYLTEERDRIDTVRVDDVFSGNLSAYVDNETRINEQWRVGLGARTDWFYFDVESDNPSNSGTDSDFIFSPKLSIIYNPNESTELYFNTGLGFHSNDARGVTIVEDPVDGSPAESVDPLVRTRGAEVGLRTRPGSTLTLAATLWWLESDSELLFVGDGGGTEASDGSERWGTEFLAYWRPTDWISLDAEYTYAHARFTGVDPDFDQIPNSIPHTFSAGAALGRDLGWQGSLRARYFSSRPLEESGSVESIDSLIFNLRAGYRWNQWDLHLDVLNLFDAADNDIEYFYTSRLPGEQLNGFDDIHLHPMEPRQFRLTLAYHW